MWDADMESTVGALMALSTLISDPVRYDHWLLGANMIDLEDIRLELRSQLGGLLMTWLEFINSLDIYL
jgi:hypothetical protein